MTQRKSYNRLFIILQEQEKGYGAAKDKEPNGYVKLESKGGKCKVCFYAQNLRSTEKYSMILITNKKAENKILNLGEPNFDSRGILDLTIEYPVENIAKSGVSIDKIDGAAIAIIDERGVRPIISGFAAKEADENWTSFQVINTEEPVKEVVHEETSNMEREDSGEENHSENDEDKIDKGENIFDKYEKEISNEEDNREEDNREEDSREEDNKGELDKVEVKENIDKEESQGEEETIQYAEDEFRNNDCKLKGSMGEYFTYIAEGLEEVHHIMPEIKNIKWYKVAIDDIKDLYSTNDHRKYTILYYPMIANYPYISKYGYYYIGYKHDKNKKLKYLVYAVPGTKKKHHQPFEGKTGYVMWVPMEEDKEYEEDVLGCWLLFYCFKTSTILLPMK